MLLDRNTIQQKYKEEYPFFKESFTRYDVIINALYAIDKDNGLLNFADIEIEELVNGNMEAFQRLEIERIPKDEIENNKTA